MNYVRSSGDSSSLQKMAEMWVKHLVISSSVLYQCVTKVTTLTRPWEHQTLHHTRVHKGLSTLSHTFSFLHCGIFLLKVSTSQVGFPAQDITCDNFHKLMCWHVVKKKKMSREREWSVHLGVGHWLWRSNRVIPLLNGQSEYRPVVSVTRDHSTKASAECWCTVCRVCVPVDMMDDMRWCTGSKWLGKTEDAQFTYSCFALHPTAM